MFIKEVGLRAMKKNLFIGLCVISAFIFSGCDIIDNFSALNPHIQYEGSGHMEPIVAGSPTIGESSTAAGVVTMLNGISISPMGWTGNDGIFLPELDDMLYASIEATYQNFTDTDASFDLGEVLVFDGDRRYRTEYPELIRFGERTYKSVLLAGETYNITFAFRIPNISGATVWWNPNDSVLFYIGTIYQ